MQQIAGRGMHHAGLEMPHQLNLTAGVAGTGRNHQHAHPFGTVMQAQATGKQPVIGHVLEHVAAAGAGGDDAAGHQFGPSVEIGLRVMNHGRHAGGAAGGMQPHHLLQIDRQQAARIGFAQVFLCGVGDVAQIAQAGDILGMM